MKTTIDEAGRILLPEDLRQQLGVNPGDDVELVERAGEWVIRPFHEVGGLCWEGNILVHKGRRTNDDTIDDTIERVRHERLSQLTEGAPE